MVIIRPKKKRIKKRRDTFSKGMEILEAYEDMEYLQRKKFRTMLMSGPQSDSIREFLSMIGYRGY